VDLLSTPKLTIDEAAEALCVSRSSVGRLIKKGEVPIVRIGGSIRLLPSDLNAYLERQYGLVRGAPRRGGRRTRQASRKDHIGPPSVRGK